MVAQYCGGYRGFEVSGEEIVDLGPASLVLTRVGPDMVRVVLRRGGSEAVHGDLCVREGASVTVAPHPPTGGPASVDCLLVRFPESVFIPPGGTVRLDLTVPVDVGLYVRGSLAAVVPVRVKYALYGPPDLGDLCRYSSQELVHDLGPCLRPTLRVRLSNESGTAVRVSRTVVPLRGLGVYLTSERLPLVTSARMVVRSQSYAEVTTELLPSLDVEGVSALVVAPSVVTYVMRYGL